MEKESKRLRPILLQDDEQDSAVIANCERSDEAIHLFTHITD